jgi:hypothetical protein
MNDSKTEFILLGSRQQLAKCITNQINVNGQCVERTNIIKYLGAWIDQNVSFKRHIVKKCGTAMGSLFRIRNIRKYLTQDACHTLVRGLVLSHLDYANAILLGLPECDIKKLQRVQNMAAKVTLSKGKYDSSTECLKALHWLPVRHRITHKVLCLVYKALHGAAPKYMTEMLTLKQQRRGSLRSNEDYMTLEEPCTKRKTFAHRSFSVMGAVLWNKLPNDIKMSESISQFKAKLKTHLYDNF